MNFMFYFSTPKTTVVKKKKVNGGLEDALFFTLMSRPMPYFALAHPFHNYGIKM